MIGKSIFFLLTIAVVMAPGAGFESENYGPSADFYRAPPKSADIAPTVATAPHEGLFVFGQPRVTKGHPSTIWDVEDIDHYKDMLKADRELRLLYADLKSRMDDRLAQPIEIPPPRKDSEGRWLFPGEYFSDFPGFPGEDSLTKFRRYLIRDAEAVSDLGIAYALGGDIRYADYAKALLLGYANASRYGAPKTLYYRSNQGMTGQLLFEALLLDKLAFGYDLIYNSPSWTPEQRTRIHDELLQPFAAEMLYPSAPEVDPTGSFARQANNRGAIGATSVLLAGYATDDPELVNAALYGIRTSLKKPNVAGLRQFPPPKDWVAADAADPSNGLLTVHFASPCIPGGMWVEGSPSYTFYVLGSMIDAAEAAWHHGLDLYRHNNGIFKYMFDFPLLFGYPDMTTPGENDAFRASMLKGLTPTLYEYAYRRYRDPRYLDVINNPDEKHYLSSIMNSSAKMPNIGLDRRHLGLSHVDSVPPSLLFDLDPNKETAARESPNVNYPSVGFGILRTRSADQRDIQSLILSYGPSAQHGHPDKLHLDLYAFGDVLMPSPGIQYPYAGNLLIDKWYHTTLSHNTMTVDETSQAVHPHNDRLPDVRADQILYAPGETFGMQRAWTGSAYTGVIMDRAVFFGSEYLADLFGVFSEKVHEYDLAWHIRGEANSDLVFAPKVFPEAAPGYSALTDVLHSEPTENAWSVSLSHEGHTARLLHAAGGATEVFIGKGGVYVDFSSSARDARPTATTIIERRENTQSTVFGNALDISEVGNGYVKSVIQYNGLNYNYSLLKIVTQVGTDYCFAAYDNGKHDVQGLHTDAIQAFVQIGSGPRALYLGGGTELAIEGAFIRRDEPGLAYIEPSSSGEYILANPSPTSANITLLFPALRGLHAYVIDRWDRRQGPANITNHPNDVISVHLDAETRIEFAQ